MSGPDMRAPAPNAHPLVKFLHKQCIEQRMSRNELARRSGLGESTLQNWWDARGAIILENIEAAMNVLGYRIAQRVMPELCDGAPKITPGLLYRTRQGEHVKIERFDGHIYSGHWQRTGIGMAWNAAGKRIPSGGEDPFDIVAQIGLGPQSHDGVRIAALGI